MTDADCAWLAGFIDGEGCFEVAYNNRSKRRKDGTRYYQCRFALGMRADDEITLREIQARTGLGHVRRYTPTDPDRHPNAHWTIESKGDALALVGILDRAGLRSKKLFDYTRWRAAVFEWQKDEYDPAFLERMREEIRASRKHGQNPLGLA